MAALGTAGFVGHEYWDKVNDVLWSPKVPSSINAPGNILGIEDIESSIEGVATNSYDNGYGSIPKSYLVNAAQSIHRNSKPGLSPDAQAFDSLWRYFVKDSHLPNQNMISGVKIQGHFGEKKKNVKNKDGKIVKNEQLSHYELAVFTSPQRKEERVIKFSWSSPYDQKVVDKMRKEGVTDPIDFTGFNEFRQYGEGGAIQMYKNDTKTGKRVWPRTIDKDELIKYLGELPGLQK